MLREHEQAAADIERATVRRDFMHQLTAAETLDALDSIEARMGAWGFAEDAELGRLIEARYRQLDQE